MVSSAPWASSHWLEDTFRVSRISGKVGKSFIIEHHYSGGCHNGPMCWGLFSGKTLIGVCAFATPCSENVRSSVFGEDYKDHVTELHRLAIIDDTPNNTESWFIARALRGLKKERPHLWAILSFADSTQGHQGIIYQASNFSYCGSTGRTTFFRDKTGRLRHPRQNGVNITREQADVYGWIPEIRDSKYRYLKFIPDNKRHSKKLRALCKLTIQSFPNKINAR
jgi:hypothetical protein